MGKGLDFRGGKGAGLLEWIIDGLNLIWSEKGIRMTDIHEYSFAWVTDSLLAGHRCLAKSLEEQSKLI